MEYPDNNQITTENGKKRYLTLSSALVLLVVFFILAAGFFWWLNNCNLTLECKTTENISNLEISGGVIKKNETVAQLTAQVIKKHMDGLLVLGSFYSQKKEVAQYIQQEKWLNAINIIVGAFKEDELNAIDRIALFDITGILKANAPEQQNQLIGQSFAYRDWYGGVMADFKPYVSEVYIRTTKPPANVIGMAFPIKNNNDTPIAILLFTLKTDSFLKWLNELKFGESGRAFIVDKRGHIIAHPDIPPQGEITDYSSRTDVQKAISGQSGTEITSNSKNQRTLSSYEPIPDFHWGIITRIELDEVINAGLIKDNSLGQIEGGGIIRKIIEKIIPP